MSKFMDFIRTATPEEVEKFANRSDLEYTQSEAWAFGDPNGDSDVFFIKNVVELDPIWFSPNTPKNIRSMRLWAVENMLRGRGIPKIYFNIETRNKDFMDTMELFGAERQSPTETVCEHCGASDIRFKKIIDPRIPEKAKVE